MSTLMSVMLWSAISLAIALVIIKLLVLPKVSKSVRYLILKIFNSFIAVTGYIYAYCMLEVVICAFVEIAATGGGLSWFVLTIYIAP